LANSVVSLLELLFPKTIDKLLKETSEQDGPKPVVIDSCSEKQLNDFLNSYQIWGGNVESQSAESKDSKHGKHFGSNQVVIVRD